MSYQAYVDSEMTTAYENIKQISNFKEFFAND